MAVTFIDSDQNYGEGGVALTFTIDTGIVQVGDVIVAFGTYPSGGTPGASGPDPTTGWTELTAGARPGLPLGNAEAGSVHTIWARKFTGSVPSTIDFVNVTPSSSNRRQGVMYGIWRGLDDPSVAGNAVWTRTYDTSGTQTSRDHPTIDVPTGGGLVIVAGHWDNSDIAATRTYPSGFTERQYLNYTEDSSLVNTQYFASDESNVAGATGALTFSWGAGNNAAKVLFTVALKEAAAGGSSIAAIANYYNNFRS